MKKSFLFLAAFMTFIMTLPLQISVSEAVNMNSMRKKRYRYRQRTHRFQIAVDANIWNQNSKKDKAFDLHSLYGFNFGYGEIGPNISISNEGTNFNNITLKGGVWGEINFIKNTRKTKFTPSLGIKLNFENYQSGQIYYWYATPYIALKYFPASRTGMILNLNYDFKLPQNNLSLDKLEMGFNVSVAYAHYFHF